MLITIDILLLVIDYSLPNHSGLIAFMMKYNTTQTTRIPHVLGLESECVKMLELPTLFIDLRFVN